MGLNKFLRYYLELTEKRGFIGSFFIALNFILTTKIFKKLPIPFGLAWPFVSMIQIEPTKLCNLKCPMCTNPYMDPKDKGSMSYVRFLKIIKQMPLLVSVTLQGLGEPFLNPHLFKMIKFLKKRGVHVSITTNGTLVNKRVSKKILKTGLDHIIFSLDTLKKERYKIIRGIDMFEKVVDNIKNFMKLKKKIKNNTRVTIKMVVTELNIDEIEDIIQFTSSMGINELVISIALIKPYSSSQEHFLKDKIITQSELEEIKTKATNLSKKHGINVFFLENKKRAALGCRIYRYSGYITYDGFITPCCHIENPKYFNLGNVLTYGFYKIWNGKKYREFRKNFFDRNGPCRKCPYYLYGSLR